MSRLIDRPHVRAAALCLLAPIWLLAACGKPTPVATPAASPSSELLPPGMEQPVAPAPGAPDDGKRWIQQTTITLGKPAKFAECVPRAFATIPSLKPAGAPADAKPGVLSYDTPIAGTYPGLVIVVAPPVHDSIDIQYVGRGFRETAGARQSIAPELRALSNAVFAACAS